MTIAEQQQLIARAEQIAGGLPQLALAIGVRPSTVYRWLHGTRRMHGIAERVVRGYITDMEVGNV